jgi:hypothetical protein
MTIAPLKLDATTGSRLTRLRRSATGEAATEAAKALIRAAAVATADLRPGPELLLIGSKRGGTTSLWRYLIEHPGVLPTVPRAEKIKGVYYFDENWARGDEWYRSHFPSRARRAVVARRLGYEPVAMDASPYYLFHPLAPERARATVPDAHIVAVLRNPVERAYSHWKERRNHTEALSFAEAIDAEEVRTRGEEERILADPDYVSFAHRHQTYVAQGMYAPMLERWFAAFPREQVTVLPAEEFYADPQALVDQLCDRLSLPRHRLASVEPFNAEPSAGMDPAVRARLEERLAPAIAAVEELLGREMPWR